MLKLGCRMEFCTVMFAVQECITKYIQDLKLSQLDLFVHFRTLLDIFRKSKKFAGLAYWLCPSLPNWLKEFDSPIPLQS